MVSWKFLPPALKLWSEIINTRMMIAHKKFSVNSSNFPLTDPATPPELLNYCNFPESPERLSSQISSNHHLILFEHIPRITTKQMLNEKCRWLLASEDAKSDLDSSLPLAKHLSRNKRWIILSTIDTWMSTVLSWIYSPNYIHWMPLKQKFLCGGVELDDDDDDGIQNL